MRGAHDLMHSEVPNPVGAQRRQQSRVRVLLADDNAEFLNHVSDLLQSDFDIVGKVADGSVVCAEIGKLRPDIVILDISMGEFSGIEVAQRLREQGYEGEIMFLTVHEDLDFVNAAFGSGGRAYVIKYRMDEDLRPAVNAVLSQQIFISAPLNQD